MRRPDDNARKSQALRLLKATTKGETNLVSLANKVVEGVHAYNKLKEKTLKAKGKPEAVEKAGLKERGIQGHHLVPLAEGKRGAKIGLDEKLRRLQYHLSNLYDQHAVRDVTTREHTALHAPSKPMVKRELDPKEGVTITHGTSAIPKIMWVKAHKEGKEVGSALILNTGRKYMKAHDVRVHPEHRRKGIATAMYRHAEEATGKEMVPSNDKTSDGLALWRGTRGYSTHGHGPFGAHTQRVRKEMLVGDQHTLKPFHGWISPKGEFHQMDTHQQHIDAAVKHLVKHYPKEVGDGDPAEQLYHHGWISTGHGGDATVQGHTKTLSDNSHPATQKLRSMVREHVPEENFESLGVSHMDNHSNYDMREVHHRHARAGNFRGTSMLKSDDGEGHLKNPFAGHMGFISPEGKVHPVGGKGQPQDHLDFMAGHPHGRTIPEKDWDRQYPFDHFHKHGWVSYGHGGAANVEGYSHVLNDKSHPATKALHGLLRQHSVGKLEVYHSDQDKLRYMDTGHYLKHGMQSRVGFRKSLRTKYTMSHSGDSKGITVEAHTSEGDHVGTADFKYHPTENTMHGIGLYVHEDHRQSGVAHAMLRHAELTSKRTISGGIDQEPSSVAFWDSFKKNDPTNAVFDIHGIQVNIEWPKGSTRQYKDGYKKEMKCHYGYFARADGDDGEELDTYVGDHLDSKRVFLIQQNDTNGGEEKVMLGFRTPEEAKQAFLTHMEEKNFGSLREMTLDELKSRISKRPESLPNGVQAADGEKHIVKAEEEHIELEHYSQNRHETLDPAHHGTGYPDAASDRGRGRKHQHPESWVPRTYHYEAGSKPEHDIGHFRYKHTSRVPKSKIYDVGADHKGFLDKPYKSFNEVEGRLKDAGYHGFKNSKHPSLSNVVATFHPLKPHKIEDQHLGKTAGGWALPHKFSIISGEQPRHEVGDKRPLEHHLKEAGYKYEKMSGQYGGTKESSFLVHNANPSHIERLGEKYGQESVIHSNGGKHKLVFTGGANKGQHHAGEGHTVHPSEPKDNFSHYRGRHFTLHFNFDKLHKTYSVETLNERLEMLKGAMQRLAPSAKRPRGQGEERHVYNWQASGGYTGDYTARESMPHIAGGDRVRALHKLTAATKTRRAADGGREFLLHRGMGSEEHAKTDRGTHVSHEDRRSSWTPSHEIAHELFGEKAAVRGKHTVSAWVHEKHIVHVPRQIGGMAGKANVFDKEHEVVVERGHHSEKAKPGDVGGRDLHTDISHRARVVDSMHTPEAKAIMARDELKQKLTRLRDAAKSLSATVEPGKIVDTPEDMDKGIKQALAGAAAAVAIAATPASVNQHGAAHAMHRPSVQAPAAHPHDKFLGEIARVESTSGKYTDHRQMKHGMHAGTAAIGRYGLMPKTVKYLARSSKNKDIQSLASADHAQVAEKLKSNPSLEHAVAREYAGVVHRTSRGNEAKMAYRWLHGHNAKVSTEQAKKHPYVQEYMKKPSGGK